MSNKTKKTNDPYSQEAEQTVLGSLMSPRASEEIFFEVSNLIKREDFYRLDHSLIFDAISQVWTREGNCDFILVAEQLNSEGKLDTVGNSAYIQELAKVATAHGAVLHAKIIKENSLKRQLVEISKETISVVANPEGKDAEAMVVETQSRLDSILTENKEDEPVHLKDVMRDVYSEYERRESSESPLIGLSTGFNAYDEFTLGLEKGSLIIVGARPGMGKTTFAVNIAEHVALKLNEPTLVFSLEMPAKQLGERMACSVGGLDSRRFRRGELTDNEVTKMTPCFNKLMTSKVYIDDAAGTTIDKMRSKARRMKKMHGLSLIVVDYLQLMRAPEFSGNKVQEISEISRFLKELAKECDVPVVALSQLNRSLENRPNKRPVMSDLRESGGIEQDADVIVFLYRDVVYDQDSPFQNEAELIIAKNRQGEIGTVMLMFEGQYTRFRNFSNTEKEELMHKISGNGATISSSDEAAPIDDDYGTEGYHVAEVAR